MATPIPGIQLEDQPEPVLMSAVLWGEARGEGSLGKLAILWVIKNRATKRGTTLKEEILRPLQFSSFNAHDPNRSRLMLAYTIDARQWRLCETVVDLFPWTRDPVNGADHYYAYEVVQPVWGRGHALWQEKAVIGKHVFGIAP